MRALRIATAQIGTKIGITNQMIVKASIVQCCLAQLPHLSKVIAPYIIFDRKMLWYFTLSLPLNGFPPIGQNKWLEDNTGPLLVPMQYLWSVIRSVSQKTCARQSISPHHVRAIDVGHGTIESNALNDIGPYRSDLNKS